MEDKRRQTIRRESFKPPEALWLAMILLCLWMGLGAGISASAAENDSGQEPDADTVMIRVEAQAEEIDRDALLERINAIRREACEEGINNPVNGVPLTAEDYVPLEWSYALEEIAALRAAESTILQDHIRPDGRECFTAAPEGVSFTMETLAWGFGSAAEPVEGWYSEKASYVEPDGSPAGHYMALINPENRYVGIAQLRPQWQRNACAGAFGERGAPGEPAAAEGNIDGETVRMIPLKRELLPSVIERALELTAGRIFKAAVKICMR